MWRTISLLGLLIGLLSWAVYDHQTKKNVENQIKTPSVTSISQDAAKLGIQNGNMAPDIQLMTLKGVNTKLSNYRGKKVILNFWASWCPPCKAEMPNIEAFYQANKDHNVMVLAVNLTTTEKNKDQVQLFVKDQGLTFPIFLDQQGKVGNLYQALTIPTSYIIDTKGIVQQKIVGPMSQETMEKLISKIN